MEAVAGGARDGCSAGRPGALERCSGMGEGGDGGRKRAPLNGRPTDEKRWTDWPTHQAACAAYNSVSCRDCSFE